MQASKLTEKHPGWVNVNTGELVRAKLAGEGMESVRDLVGKGELAREGEAVSCCHKNIEEHTVKTTEKPNNTNIWPYLACIMYTDKLLG